MRGERPFGRYLIVNSYGSSPHARGTPPFVGDKKLPQRFIPACAGNAVLAALGVGTVTVHPRMRGERGRISALFQWKTGSSPHARGTRFAAAHNVPLCRFIPACAGNASSGSRPPGDAAVHPRMRGERAATETRETIDDGSSPHARGTHGVAEHRRKPYRFIPACAGNAPCPVGQHLVLPVHPRMRGERVSPGGRTRPTAGSSPHARGTQAGGKEWRKDDRFIPACAGNAGYGRRPDTCATVHPRMRGERSN